MKATIEHQGRTLTVNLSHGLDISIPLSSNGPRAWFVDKAIVAPVINQHFTGSVALGGAVNFNNIQFNPHGHGTHTESVGHIAHEVFPISTALVQYFFLSQVISISPEQVMVEDGWQKIGDSIITKEQLQTAIKNKITEALVIRTMPNNLDKKTKNYSNTNFCYIENEALSWLAAQGVQHLLVDLPSVDREADGGLLKSHRAFWNYPHATRKHSTITEFIYVADTIADGEYLLNLQVASFENDAAPSRPVLFKLL
jgi:arylformamidase